MEKKAPSREKYIAHKDVVVKKLELMNSRLAELQAQLRVSMAEVAA